MTRLFLFMTFVAVAGLTGCGPTCQSVCEDQQTCTSVSEQADCATSCSKTEAVVEGTGCRLSYNKYLRCASEDPCNVLLACFDEGVAYGGCTLEFCSANPDEPVCDPES